MRRTGWAAVAIATLVVLAYTGGAEAGDEAGPEAGDAAGGDAPKCSEATLHGTYGIQIQGTRPAPPPAPPGTIESVIGIVIRDYDGKGNFTQVNNEKGSISGNAPPDREGYGTYQVNDDCTGAHQLQIPGVPFVITDRFVIVEHGREVRNFVVSPAPVMVTGVSRRIR